MVREWIRRPYLGLETAPGSLTFAIPCHDDGKCAYVISIDLQSRLRRVGSSSQARSWQVFTIVPDDVQSI